MKRRNFVKITGASSLLACIAPLSACAEGDKTLKILVLGGTDYFGPAIVQSLLARDHKVTLFNRGITNPDLFPELEKLRGDRAIDSENLKALTGKRKWDVVIDVWTADPRMVRRTLNLLKDRVQHFVFISTKVVYANYNQEGISESYPLRQVQEFHEEMPYRETKVLCENIFRELVPNRHTILRPPGTFGKRDKSWSLVYWLWRIRNGGKVLAPGDGSDIISYSDVGDIADFVGLSVEKGLRGAFNTIGPNKERLPFKTFLNTINAHYGNKAEFIWVDESFLLNRHQLQPIRDIPMWVPKSESKGFYTMSSQKAIDAGMTFRPMEETFDSALGWYDTVKSPQDDPGLVKDRPFNGISRTKELELLEEWAALKQQPS